MRSKTYSFRDFSGILNRNGYVVVRTKGDHWIYKNNEGRTISVNVHLNKMVANRLIKENTLTVA